MASTNGLGATKELDVLIIGAGFGGCYGLYRLRQQGYKVHVFEAGKGLGGVWHWNTYPGARVDSEIPYYQFSMPEVWRKWTWTERFPSGDELRAYFRHVDQTLGLSKDISYGANVVGATFDDESGRWTVTTEAGQTAVCKYLICATGSSFRPHIPDFKNLDRFRGQLIHSTRYPAVANTKNARVAIVGSGATAVQCTQEITKEAAQLTVFIRTASISLPMVQRPFTELEERIGKSTLRRTFAYCRSTTSGLGYDRQLGSVFDLSDEEREDFWEDLWSRGGFNFNQANYRDFLVDPRASRMMYDFWAKKTRPRVRNPEKAAFLVPEEPPFAFGTKRSSLEQDYYERIDQDNVDVVNLKATPIREFTETGIITTDGRERPFDIVILATGFDAMTGSLTNMNIRGRDGLTFQQRWKDGVFTHLGLCSSGCPNLFMIYGPQAPTAFTNGPVFIESQVDVVIDLLNKLQSEGIKSIEAQRPAEEKWKQAIQDANDKTLLPLTDSWYMGANIPGKKREQLNYLGGIANYEKECREAIAGLDGFTVVYDKA
ncbi:cyclopentanone monooxygenase [Grosmannia clavigera kw1407]|uniref:Cyclopentanone monooxygenase n=1 Tax=Grosmannia clavigera (strain kw1407 / UAMH 11150) TaxID=655863 RepID=F0X7B3_GROCL|nr:cyclopentanone monooxygenase [Grosmannia clavigera kw1407]EFX06686.1 cyclopentanone monooxygenase [Grosmannia clavigera kw1407]